MVNVEEKKARARRRPNVWWVALVSGMAAFIDMVGLYATAMALVIYQHHLHFSNLDYGILTATITFGVAFGALIGGRLGDRFGRKKVFSVTMIVIMAASVILVFSTTLPMLFVGMALMGLGTGADLPVSIAAGVEAAGDENRGKVVGLSAVLWLAGAAFATLVGTFVGNWGMTGGQIMFALPGAIALLVFLARLTIPESETWVDAKNERAQGVQTIRADRAQIRDLFRTPYAKAFIALLCFYGLQNVCSNSVGQLGAWVNVNIVHMSVSTSSALIFITLGIGIICALIFMKFVDTRHRKWLLYIGAILYIPGFLAFPLGGFTPAMWMIVGSFAQIGSTLGGEPLMKVLCQESFPTLLRSTAQGAIIATGRFTAGIAAIFMEVIVAANPDAAFVGLAVLALCAYAFMFWGFPRARGINSFAVDADADPAAVNVVGSAPAV